MAAEINSKILKQVAALAKLHVPDEQIDHLVTEFRQIVAYVEQMNAGSVDQAAPSDLKPIAQRPDEVRPGLSRQAAFANAPESDGESFLVPLVLGE